MVLQIEFDGEKRIVFTGSSVLMRQAEKHREQMPFLATIAKNDKYYTFS